MHEGNAGRNPVRDCCSSRKRWAACRLLRTEGGDKEEHTRVGVVEVTSKERARNGPWKSPSIKSKHSKT